MLTQENLDATCTCEHKSFRVSSKVFFYDSHMSSWISLSFYFRHPSPKERMNVDFFFDIPFQVLTESEEDRKNAWVLNKVNTVYEKNQWV